MSKYSKEWIRSTEYCLKQYERDYKLMNGSYYGSMKLRILYNILNCKRVIAENKGKDKEVQLYYHMQLKIFDMLEKEDNNDKTYEKRCDSLVKQLELEKDFV